jgi:16S rRNA (uracil1498-N3)-methyltransferase
MQYYFNVKLVGNRFSFSPMDIHHILNVIRAKNGDKVVCVHEGTQYLCVLQYERDIPFATIDRKLQNSNELPFEITLIYGIPKNDKFELVLQKATELGVSRIVPYQADRSIVKLLNNDNSSKLIRWNRILKEASEQSRRNKIPEITPITSLDSLVAYLGEWNFVADENKWSMGTSELWDYCQKKMPNSISLVIGPEGGFSQNELNFLQEKGWKSISLGRRILRSETAAISLLSWFSFLGDSYYREVVQ